MYFSPSIHWLQGIPYPWPLAYSSKGRIDACLVERNTLMTLMSLISACIHTISTDSPDSCPTGCTLAASFSSHPTAWPRQLQGQLDFLQTFHSSHRNHLSDRPIFTTDRGPQRFRFGISAVLLASGTAPFLFLWNLPGNAELTQG